MEHHEYSVCQPETTSQFVTTFYSLLATKETRYMSKAAMLTEEDAFLSRTSDDDVIGDPFPCG